MERTLDEVREQMKDADRRWAVVKEEIRALRDEEITLLKEKGKAHIGRCFQEVSPNNRVYAIIVDVPQVQQGMTSTFFNEHQFPALFCCPSKIADNIEEIIWNDTFFDKDMDAGYKPPKGMTVWEEISTEEFTDAFNKALRVITTGVTRAMARGVSNRVDRNLEQAALQGNSTNFDQTCGGWLSACQKIATDLFSGE